MKKSNSIISAVQLISALAVIGAVKLFAPVCAGMLDLANGNQTHMKCYFTGQAAIAIAVIMAVLALISLFASKDFVKIQLATLASDAMLLLCFYKLIGICANPDMSCHTTVIWVAAAAAVSAIAALAGILRSREGQIPS